DSLTTSGKLKITTGARMRMQTAVLGGAEASAPAGARPLGPFSPKPGGFLSVSCGSGVRVRRGIVVGRTGAPVLEDSPSAGPDGLGVVLVGVAGDGVLLVADPGRVPWLKALASETLSVDPERLLAFQNALHCRPNGI